MSAHDIAAADLHEAEKSGKQIGLLSKRHPEWKMDDGYAVQAALVKRKLASGRRIIGWKIGLTSKAMQDALKINIPDSGILFDDMLFADGAIRLPRAASFSRVSKQKLPSSWQRTCEDRKPPGITS